MTELAKKQLIFTKYLSKLLEYALTQGATLIFGEAWRSGETCAMYAREGKGVPHSCHMLRLAVDFEIRKDDGSVSNQKADYQALGDYWKQLPSLYPNDINAVTCWGGDFINLCDFYHFSITHNGVK